MVPSFFITHSWKDIEFARRLCDDLKAHGLDGFFDERSIRPGESIPSRIERGLVECDYYLPVFSPDALLSPWCEWEIDMAIMMNRTRKGRPHIIPVLAEKCDLPFRLQHLLYVSFIGRYNDAFHELLTKGFGVREIHKAPTDDTPPLGRNSFQPIQSSTQQLPINSTEESSQVPLIISAIVTPELITGGESVRLQVRVKSQAPVNWLNITLDGPRGNLQGGGSTHNFTEISPGTWESEWKYDISKWAPSGIYTFSNISVKNEAESTSAWQPISFKVVTPPVHGIAAPPAPVIQTPPHTEIGKDGEEMILVPAGEFLMGSNKLEEEKPIHNVYLDAFYISRYPVTNAEYKKFMDATKHASSYWTNRQIPAGKENHPVVAVSWNEAVAYAKWAGGRLPTEAEWEKAASWDDAKKEKRIYPWGNEFDASKCNSSISGIGDTTLVGKYSPQGDSFYGVGDMAGNVWEWCADWFDVNYYRNQPASNPKGPTSGQDRVLRGGAFYYGQGFVRCAYRYRGYLASGATSLVFGWWCPPVDSGF